MTAIAYPNFQMGTEGDALIAQFASAAMRRFGVYNRYIGEATSLEDLVIQLSTARSVMLGITTGAFKRPGLPFPPERAIEGITHLIEQYTFMTLERGSHASGSSTRDCQGLQ